MKLKYSNCQYQYLNTIYFNVGAHWSQTSQFFFFETNRQGELPNIFKRREPLLGKRKQQKHMPMSLVKIMYVPECGA